MVFLVPPIIAPETIVEVDDYDSYDDHGNYDEQGNHNPVQSKLMIILIMIITKTVMIMMNMMNMSSISPTVLLAEQEYKPESSLFTPFRKQ